MTISGKNKSFKRTIFLLRKFSFLTVKKTAGAEYQTERIYFAFVVDVLIHEFGSFATFLHH